MTDQKQTQKEELELIERINKSLGTTPEYHAKLDRLLRKAVIVIPANKPPEKASEPKK